ncbi:hypothetical protein [Gordonia sp. (in: high G+C Gram-positive bacteria)]|uniref:hypothetical protein n=1 Tax=Gordonia sp. (in: high G+C Gram-positive bacteria) TaxID=84139 RepID=UPI0039E2F455
MALGLAAAILAALGYGLATVFQARAAAAQRPADDASPTLRSTIATVLSATFVFGIALDAIGFIGNLVAARELPLYVAQPIMSANLAVTAIAAALLLGVVLAPRDRVAIVAVVLALVALGVASGQEGGPTSGWAGAHRDIAHWGVLVVAVVLLVVGLALVRMARGIAVSAAAGLLAGALWGAMAIAVRIVDGLDPFSLGQLLADPAAYAVVLGGVGGFYLFTVALQTGSVNATAAALVVGETVLPSAIGLALLGDHVRHGWGAVAVVAFAVAIVGAVTIALGETARIE